jgi:hypothetical protein
MNKKNEFYGLSEGDPLIILSKVVGFVVGTPATFVKYFKDDTFQVKTVDETARFNDSGHEWGRNKHRRCAVVTEENAGDWAGAIETANESCWPSAYDAICLVRDLQRQRRIARFWGWFEPLWRSRLPISYHGILDGTGGSVYAVYLRDDWTTIGKPMMIIFVEDEFGGVAVLRALWIAGPDDLGLDWSVRKDDQGFTPDLIFRCVSSFPINFDLSALPLVG